MNRLVPTLGFLLLTAAVIALLGFTANEARRFQLAATSTMPAVAGVLGTAFVLMCLATALVEVVSEAKRVPCITLSEVASREHFLNGLAVIGGAFMTYWLSMRMGLGAVTASALVALVAVAVVDHQAVPIYCGSFVGMTSVQLFLGCRELSMASAIAAVVYVLTVCAYPGLGGKLGTTAFVGCAITALSLGRPFLVTSIPDSPTILLVIAYAVVAVVATYWINVRMGNGPVVASAIVGIVGGLILPTLHPANGSLLAVVVFCASFSGMSSAERFPELSMMWGVGLVTGLIFVYSMPLGAGAGGKLGTIAFAASLAVRGFLDVAQRCLPARN